MSSARVAKLRAAQRKTPQLRPGGVQKRPCPLFWLPLLIPQGQLIQQNGVFSYFNPLDSGSASSVCIRRLRGFALALRRPAETSGGDEVTDNQPKHPWISLRPTSPLLYFPGQKSIGMPLMKFDAWARIAVCKVDADRKAFLLGHPHSIHSSSNVKGI